MNDPIYTLEQRQLAFSQLKEVKTELDARGWFPATSGNLSVRVGEFASDRFAFAVTSSGRDKSKHSPEDYLIVDGSGRPVEPTRLKPSAETLIHCEIYRLTGCGAVFHVHTVYNNIISELYAEGGYVPFQGVELIKAFNIWEEDARIEVPILPNYADIARIAALVEGRLDARVPGIVLRNHGIYAWGANVFEAKRHLEAFEFLFEYAYRWKALNL
ncbi:methylthioribulose 1-phosphate dehydratase [Paenibacillus mesophilus]|uniref:methylthioribulose 1-phosphate dehydratase n=1 Tax=Paenibacillus mesophilus TaxID=2582849 RepID=UPI00110E2C3A|nr:methylthioribulose 1-phosphate dehydratase [Paenibacillus mesophilus]TMV51221.1 methylthioribulose 1-phosphate dehydratase [Paenibacillus mesophilus]